MVAPKPIVNHYRVNKTFVAAAETKALIWDSSLPGEQEEVLNNDDLRQRLTSLSSIWKHDGEMTAGVDARFVLVTTSGATTRATSPLQIQRDTLQYLVDLAGFEKTSTEEFLKNWLPFHGYSYGYDDNDKPCYMTIVLRLPRHRENIFCLMRIHLRTLNTFVFLSCLEPSDSTSLRQHLLGHSPLLRCHPLHLLPLLYSHRYHKWSDWFAELWRDIAEIEALTKMGHPLWVIDDIEAERVRTLSNVNALLAHLYGINLEMTHSQTVMTFARRLGTFCGEAMDELEKKRGELDLEGVKMRKITRRERAVWEESVTTTRVRFEAVGDRLIELKERLVGQINVVYNMIDRRDSEVNLTVARLQSHDSRTVKGIAVLTLLFLPSTLIATIWTTNIIHIEGERNWQAYLGASIVLTLLVFLGWMLYVRWSKRRQGKHWPIRATIGNLNFSAA
ncbi:hypothetical protein MFIFM68171_08194 [Madurella fahalii]|uniref:Uncharacterized protein n=1 Tax=Madurella fahalii TaxID=1157608 RepID=A0ABQ0GJW1_9PEZI